MSSIRDVSKAAGVSVATVSRALRSPEKVAEVAFSGATGRKHNEFKIALGKRVVSRALHQAATMEI